MVSVKFLAILLEESSSMIKNTSKFIISLFVFFAVTGTIFAHNSFQNPNGYETEDLSFTCATDADRYFSYAVGGSLPIYIEDCFNPQTYNQNSGALTDGEYVIYSTDGGECHLRTQAQCAVDVSLQGSIDPPHQSFNVYVDNGFWCETENGCSGGGGGGGGGGVASGSGVIFSVASTTSMLASVYIGGGIIIAQVLGGIIVTIIALMGLAYGIKKIIRITGKGGFASKQERDAYKFKGEMTATAIKVRKIRRLTGEKDWDSYL